MGDLTSGKAADDTVKAQSDGGHPGRAYDDRTPQKQQITDIQEL